MFETSLKNNILELKLEGFEGPIDLLLSLVKDQKVDILKIKILPLAEQYLEFLKKIIKKENSKGITQSYELNAGNTLNEATIVGYKIVSKKVMKEKNGWRTMVLLEYKLS